MANKYNNLFKKGHTFGSWKLLETEAFKVGSQYKYKCQCSCGKKQQVNCYNLVKKRSTMCKSCSSKKKGSSNSNWKGYKEISSKYFSNLKYNAKKRDLSFKITMRQLYNVWKEQDGRCALSGVKLDLQSDASVDRIDSSKGYTRKNVQWVHKDINFMKGSFKINHFIKFCKMIAKNN